MSLTWALEALCCGKSDKIDDSSLIGTTVETYGG